MIEYLVLANTPKRGRTARSGKTASTKKKRSKRMARRRKNKSKKKGARRAKRRPGITLRRKKRRATLTVRGKSKASAKVRRRGKRTVIVYARRNAKRRRRNPPSAAQRGVLASIGASLGLAAPRRRRASKKKDGKRRSSRRRIRVYKGKRHLVGRRMSRRRRKDGGWSYRLSNPGGGLRGLLSVQGAMGFVQLGVGVGAGYAVARALPQAVAKATGFSQLASGWSGILAQAGFVTLAAGLASRFGGKMGRTLGAGIAAGGAAVVAGNLVSKLSAQVAALAPIAAMLPSGGLNGMGYYGYGVNDYLQLSGLPAMGIAGGMGQLMSPSQLLASQAFYGNGTSGVDDYLQVNQIGEQAIPSSAEFGDGSIY